jgi:AcrR family transcriptional regulator
VGKPNVPKERDAERARAAILEAALRRFSSHGYRGARMADVARDAGCSEALVYFHFRTKAELFREVVSRIDAETSWFGDDATPEALVAHLRDGELAYHRDARWRALDHVWGEALAGEPDLLALLRPQVRGAVGGLEALLARFDPQDAADRRSLALLLLAVSYGTRVMRRYDPDAVSPEQAADLLAIAGRFVVDALAGATASRATSQTPPP